VYKPFRPLYSLKSVQKTAIFLTFHGWTCMALPLHTHNSNIYNKNIASTVSLGSSIVWLYKQSMFASTTLELEETINQHQKVSNEHNVKNHIHSHVVHLITSASFHEKNLITQCIPSCVEWIDYFMRATAIYYNRRSMIVAWPFFIKFLIRHWISYWSWGRSLGWRWWSR